MTIDDTLRRTAASYRTAADQMHRTSVEALTGGAKEPGRGRAPFLIVASVLSIAAIGGIWTVFSGDETIAEETASPPGAAVGTLLGPGAGPADEPAAAPAEADWSSEGGLPDLLLDLEGWELTGS